MTKKILLIGGGTGGHIYPLRNLASFLLKKRAKVFLVVGDTALDKEIIKNNFQDIPVFFLKTGKIRRYFSFQNFIDVFIILKSIFIARQILQKIQPDILFFKGGYVGFPFFILTRWMTHFQGKIFSHESDISSGFLTNMIRNSADTVFESFSPTTPLPLFYAAESKKNKTKTHHTLPHIFIFGGSQGSEFVNTLILQKKEALLRQYKIILVTGQKKKLDLCHDNFIQFEFLPVEKISRYIQNSDLIISRAGATALFEIISAKKPSIIIPLPSSARNHQLKNANFFAQQNLCRILPQNNKTKKLIVPFIQKVLNDKILQENLQKSNIQNAAEQIAEKILE